MNNCVFNNDLISIVELKHYLNLLLDNNLINKDDKIQNVLRVVHPDKRENTTNITNDEFDCATTIFTGYLDFLNEKNIQDKTVAYALNLTLPSNEEKKLDNLEDMIETFTQLTNSSPDLLSEEIITRVKILGYTVFGVKFDENKDLIESEPTPLPNILAKEYEQKQNNYNSLNSQLESFQCYTQLLVEFRYLLCYAYLLRIYSKELDDFTNSDEYKNSKISSGGKKNKTRRKKYNKNKKTLKKLLIKGGQGNELVKNFKKYSTFRAYINSKIGDITKKTKDETNKDNEELDKLMKNVEFFKAYSKNSKQTRDSFYENEYDKLNAKVTEKLQEIEDENTVIQDINKAIKSRNQEIRKTNAELKKANLLYRVFNRERREEREKTGEKYVDDTLKRVIAEEIINSTLSDRSDLDKELKIFWFNNKSLFDEIIELQKQVALETEAKSAIKVNRDETMKAYYDNLSPKSKETVDTARESPEYFTFEENFKIKMLGDSETVYVITGIADDDIELYNDEIEKLSNKSYQENRLLGKTSKIEELQRTYKEMEDEIIKKSNVVNGISLYYNYIISEGSLGKESINLFLDLCENKLTKTYCDPETLSIKAETKAVINLATNVLRSDVQSPLKKQSLESFRDSNTFTQSNFIEPEVYKAEIKRQENILIRKLASQISEFRSSVQLKYDEMSSRANKEIMAINQKFSKNEIFAKVRSNWFYFFGSIIVLALNNANLPSWLDVYVVYTKLFLVTSVTPTLLKKIAPQLDNKIVNMILGAIQFMMVFTFGYMILTKSSFTSAIPYMPYPVSTAYNYYPDLIYMAKTAGVTFWNNVVLLPSFGLRDLIVANGKQVILVESSLLIATSVYGLTCNWFSLKEEKDNLFPQAQLELEKYVFKNEDLKLMVDNFIETLEKDNKVGMAELNSALKTLSETLGAGLTQGLQGVIAQANVETALQGRVGQRETQKEVSPPPLVPVKAFPPSAQGKAIEADKTEKFNQEAKANNDRFLAEGKALGM